MAKLLLISAMTYRPGHNEIGDVVHVRPDHGPKFSPAEKAGFEEASIPGSVEDYVAEEKKLLEDKIPPSMTEKEETTWERDKKYRIKCINKTATKIEGAFECRLPDTKPILFVP